VVMLLCLLALESLVSLYSLSRDAYSCITKIQLVVHVHASRTNFSLFVSHHVHLSDLERKRVPTVSQMKLRSI
jgi:hypothetical protein